jgi:hypothetical protein
MNFLLDLSQAQCKFELVIIVKSVNFFHDNAQQRRDLSSR